MHRVDRLTVAATLGTEDDRALIAPRIAAFAHTLLPERLAQLLDAFDASLGGRTVRLPPIHLDPVAVTAETLETAGLDAVEAALRTAIAAALAAAGTD